MACCMHLLLWTPPFFCRLGFKACSSWLFWLTASRALPSRDTCHHCLSWLHFHSALCQCPPGRWDYTQCHWSQHSQWHGCWLCCPTGPVFGGQQGEGNSYSHSNSQVCCLLEDLCTFSAGLAAEEESSNGLDDCILFLCYCLKYLLVLLFTINNFGLWYTIVP